MTAGQLLAMLKQLSKDELGLPVAFKCAENNLEGKVDVSNVTIASADFGKLVLIS